MSMYKVSRRCSASIAHRIYGHQGKCKQLHGHNYHFTLTLFSEQLNVLGMVVDFGDIKEQFDKWILENWDHKTLLFKEDGIARYFKNYEENAPIPRTEISDSIIHTDWNPTAENMAAHLVKVVKDRLWKSNLLPSIFAIQVDVEETDGNTASYYEDMNR